MFFKKASPTNGQTDGPTDRRTDGRTDKASYRDAWTHLKTVELGQIQDGVFANFTGYKQKFNKIFASATPPVII